MWSFGAQFQSPSIVDIRIKTVLQYTIARCLRPRRVYLASQSISVLAICTVFHCRVVGVIVGLLEASTLVVCPFPPQYVHGCIIRHRGIVGEQGAC